MQEGTGDLEKFGEYIRNKRKELSLTQIAFAKEIGVSNKMVSNWEKGRTAPDIFLLEKIANLFDISIEQLLNCEELSSKNENNTAPKRNTLMLVIIFSFLTIVILIISFFTFFLHQKNKNSDTYSNVYEFVSEKENYYVDGKIIQHDGYSDIIVQHLYVDDSIIGTSNEEYVTDMTATLYINEEFVFDYVLTNGSSKMMFSDALERIRFEERYDHIINELDSIIFLIQYNDGTSEIVIPISLKKILQN